LLNSNKVNLSEPKQDKSIIVLFQQRPSERLHPNTCHWFTHYAGSTLSPTAVTQCLI
jgi:hypothetical protein